MDDGDDRFRPLTDERKPTGEPAYSAEQEQLVSPLPKDAIPPPTAYPKFGRLAQSMTWTYRNERDETLHYVLRFDPPGRSKVILPLTLWRDRSGALRWRWRGYPPDRKMPLYGLRDLAVRPRAHVIVVEGEKAADAARRIFQDYVVVSAMGGAMAAHRADWEPLRGRTVVIWPDNDAPGGGFAHTAGGILCGLDCAVSIINSAALVQLAVDVHGTRVDPDGWDAADAIKLRDDAQTLREAALALAKPFPADSGEALDHEDEETSAQDRQWPSRTHGCGLAGQPCQVRSAIRSRDAGPGRP